ncbi:MAG: metallophosphoesterase [Burkholderiales bacterium]
MRAILIAVVALLAGCVSSPTQTPSASEYRFVVLGPEGVAIARVITTAAECPRIDFDGQARPMSVRMPPATVPGRPSRSDPPAQPTAFPVLTCEAVIPPDTRNAAIDGHPLPLPVADPQRIVLLGDTGCRIVGSFNLFQACNDPSQWPFRQVSDAAAATRPDLVIHVGDFHYRESACAPGNAGCAGSPWGYGWDAWQADLFDPARNLFAAAPWIVLRGNHESCNRAGQGWFRFLDPRPVAPRQDCNAAADDDIGNYSEPYEVPLGRNADAQVLVFDSSWVGLTPIPPTDLMYRNYRAQLEQLFALAARTPRAFFVSHHPVLGFAANPGNPQQPFPGNAGLQSVLDPMYPSVLFPPTIEALLSGHSHTLEVISFASPHPPQLLAGNGGTDLDQPFPVPFPPDRQPAPGAVVAELVTTTQFGFMTMERSGAGWRMQAWDVRGAPLTACTLGERRAQCTPVADPRAKP